MQRTKWLSALLAMLLILALALVVSAQDGESTEEPPVTTEEPDMDTTEEPEMDDDSSDDDVPDEGGSGTLTVSNAIVQGAIPDGAQVLGVAYLLGFDTYAFPLTGSALANATPEAEATDEPALASLTITDCSLIAVYKVSSEGVQDLWPQISCDGNALSIVAGGTGHYIVYAFSSAAAMSAAPTSLSTCQSDMAMADAEATPEAGAVAMAEGCWDFSAMGTDTLSTLSAQVVATAGPADDGDDDDSDDDDDEVEETAEPTVEATEGV
jgi:hypothetical protein